MNNTATIPPHTHYFSAMKVSFWIQLWSFIFVNPLPFACNIIVCDPFFIPMNSSRNGSFLCRVSRLVAIDKRSALFFSLRACGTQTSSLLIFPILPSDGVWWIMTCLTCLLIPEFSGMDCIPPMLLKHHHRSQMRTLVLFHPSMTYLQNEISQTNSVPPGQLWCPRRTHYIFFSILRSSVPMFELPQHYMTNMHFQPFHFTHFKFSI